MSSRLALAVFLGRLVALAAVVSSAALQMPGRTIVLGGAVGVFALNHASLAFAVSHSEAD